MIAQVAEESPVSSARNKVQYQTERVLKFSAQACTIADVLFGGEPSDGSKDNAPSRQGESGLLHDDIDMLGRSLDALERQISRLAALGIAPPPQATQAHGSTGGHAYLNENIRAY